MFKILIHLLIPRKEFKISPNSYCITLMVIHYLQSVGVLPWLDEIGQKEGDGYFCQDLLKIKKHFNPNKEHTLGELWLGLISYYKNICISGEPANVFTLKSAQEYKGPWHDIKTNIIVIDPLQSHINVSRRVESFIPLGNALLFLETAFKSKGVHCSIVKQKLPLSTLRRVVKTISKMWFKKLIL